MKLRRTIFDTPLVQPLLRGIAIGYLRLSGWRVDGELPANAQRCVLIAAPHTSNWDLPNTLMVAFALRLRVHWMGKQSIFRPPFRSLMQWLGGIPVDRSQTNNLVAASIAALRAGTGPLQLIVPPEGTRSRTQHWRTGFYHIAVGAQVPIVLAYMDYANKRSGLGPVFVPSGEIERDMQSIKDFYAPFKGRNPTQFST